MCLSLLLLLYGFYASIWGNACHKAVLSTFYGIFAIVLGALGICVLAFKTKIIEGLSNYLNDNQDALNEFGRELHCSTVNGAAECMNVFGSYYDKFGKGIGAALIVLFVILMVGDVLAWKFVCDRIRGRDKLGDGSDGGKQLTAPLTYSW
jgi:hypothetical protein